MARRWCRPFAGFAWLVCCVAGCDGTDNAPQDGPATRRVVTAGPAGAGVVSGTVSFNGTPPAAEEVDGSRCHTGAGTIRVEAVEVAPGGALKDVMVYVKDPQVVPAGGSNEPAVLDQVNCQYTPRVLGVRAGQVLRVKSSDATLHNVHTLSERNPRLNFGMTGAGQSRDVTFQTPEQFSVRCDVHPWMNAAVYVLDHPFFAVTGADGRFEITGLPPGEHEVVFSHPFLGERVRKVTIADGAPAAAAQVEVTYERNER